MRTAIGGVTEFLKLPRHEYDHSPPRLRMSGGIPPLLQVPSCLHSTIHPYPDILMQKLRNTRSHRQQRLLRGTSCTDVALSEIFVAQYSEAELQRVKSVAQYIDPYRGILYCQNIKRIHDTNLNAISSTAFSVPIFTILTTSVNFCGHFLPLNLLETGPKMQKQNG
jgi:hypothetical protein